MRREDFSLDPNRAAFSRINDTVGQNLALTIWFVREIEAIDRDINRQRERRREQYRTQEAQVIQNNRAQEAQLIQDHRAQEAQLIQDNRARLEADERELDAESDERHLRLRTHFESVLDGTRMPNNHSQFHIPDLLPEEQSRIVPWDWASSHVLEDLNSSQSNLTTSPMLVPEPRNHQAPPSMDVDHNENEALLDSVERQTLSSTTIGESHVDSVPANMVPPHADETLGVAPATVLPSGGARNGPNSQFERSPDSGYGSSHTSCMVCNTVLMGQNMCDSCAEVLNIEPSFWFNG